MGQAGRLEMVVGRRQGWAETGVVVVVVICSFVVMVVVRLEGSSIPRLPQLKLMMCGEHLTVVVVVVWWYQESLFTPLPLTNLHTCTAMSTVRKKSTLHLLSCLLPKQKRSRKRTYYLPAPACHCTLSNNNKQL